MEEGFVGEDADSKDCLFCKETWRRSAKKCSYFLKKNTLRHPNR